MGEFTFAVVSVVSLRFCPVRALSLCQVVTLFVVGGGGGGLPIPLLGVPLLQLTSQEARAARTAEAAAIRMLLRTGAGARLGAEILKRNYCSPVGFKEIVDSLSFWLSSAVVALSAVTPRFRAGADECVRPYILLGQKRL